MLKFLNLPRVIDLLCFISLLLEFDSAFSKAQIPASFVFGDSLVDAGNNNYLLSLAKSDYAFNGVDFQGGGVATGRFSNGRTVADIIGQELGLPNFTPVYLNPNTTGTAILKGVNYASGGGGILDETGANLIQCIALGRQVKYFTNTKAQIVDLLGNTAAAELLAKSLFSFTIGSNDYLNNFLLPLSPSPRIYTPQQFEDRIVSKFRECLTDVYNLGARKFFVAAVGPLGCIPSQLTFNFRVNGSCDPRINELIINLNKAVREMVLDLGSTLPGSYFVYGNSYNIVADIIYNPLLYGFQRTDSACCGAVGPYNGLIPCFPVAPLCPDRSASFFWDAYHPSDAGNNIVARKFLDGNLNEVYPLNVRQLSAL
ncbi:hypothetical protein O6H91_05G063700 [Diphasiastrum complanatum]|uniref:Uncharacterized protein n=1 Tax=Diphasiastrum complanatum TaxID=34168 RepID=A0ACC2DNU3_DIPCM|nr:hypothetical protein O6H91_05G063700 [Diphasiastrum complanatum]